MSEFTRAAASGRVHLQLFLTIAPMLTRIESLWVKINDATKDYENASQTSHNSRKKHIKIQENVARNLLSL